MIILHKATPTRCAWGGCIVKSLLRRESMGELFFFSFSFLFVHRQSKPLKYDKQGLDSLFSPWLMTEAPAVESPCQVLFWMADQSRILGPLTRVFLPVLLTLNPLPPPSIHPPTFVLSEFCGFDYELVTGCHGKTTHRLFFHVLITSNFLIS